MPTGACGINCDVCKLRVIGICSTCGPGTGSEAAKKLAAQIRLLGHPCPILNCARMQHIQHCPRDCAAFPCENFQRGPYPYSRGYLNMQTRRRRQKPPILTPVGEIVSVPQEFWNELRELDRDTVCRRAGVAAQPPRGFRVPFLNLDLWVDPRQRCLHQRQDTGWLRLEYPLLELVILVYLRRAGEAGLTREMISVNDLKDAHFFQGPHQLKTAPIVELFGWDSARFARAAERIGGHAVDLADVAYAMPALPKIPLYYLLWEGDDEFEANASILFDRSIQSHLNADAIWGLVNLVTDFLLTAD